jgi:hypothetical protein
MGSQDREHASINGGKRMGYAREAMEKQGECVGQDSILSSTADRRGRAG